MLHVKRSLYLSRLSPIITAAFYAYNTLDEYAKLDSSPIKHGSIKRARSLLHEFDYDPGRDKIGIRVDFRWGGKDITNVESFTISKEKGKIFFEGR